MTSRQWNVAQARLFLSFLAVALVFAGLQTLMGFSTLLTVVLAAPTLMFLEAFAVKPVFALSAR